MEEYLDDPVDLLMTSPKPRHYDIHLKVMQSILTDFYSNGRSGFWETLQSEVNHAVVMESKKQLSVSKGSAV